MFFAAAITIIGMPPLSGFVGKLHILEAARVGDQANWLWPVVLGSTLVIMVALARAGSKMFWHTLEGKAGETRSANGQLAAVMVLLSAALLLTVFAQPVSAFTDAIANDLYQPQRYIYQVLGGSNL